MDKKENKKPARRYKNTDAGLLQQSLTMHAAFEENKQAFVDRFPDLADPFADNWLAATNSAGAITSDFQKQAVIMQKTTALVGLMEEARQVLQTLFTYGSLAFPGDAAMARALGKNEYSKSKGNQAKMPLLLRMAHQQASKPDVKALLLAKGMKETEIARMIELSELLSETDVNQEGNKSSRTINTAVRIDAMNTVFGFMQQVNTASKLVFASDAARLAIFKLRDGSPRARKTGEEETGVV